MSGTSSKQPPREPSGPVTDRASLSSTYPNCGCDVYSHLYSFSFNPNPNWSQELAEQPEIEQYMDDTIDKVSVADTAAALAHRG